MHKLKILVVIGARPQFIKHAPFEILAKERVDIITIHTGQHYDSNMSQIFFDQLGIRKPKYLLNTGGGNHGAQTGKMLEEIEPILLKENPDYLLVYGDTNSTIAGSLAAAKLHIPVIHIEAGLRSFNKDMPEEINRILTDHMSSVLFTSTSKAIENLKIEGIKNNVFFVGDIMTDAVKIALEINTNKGNVFNNAPYYYATIHRPYNTDDQERIYKLLSVLDRLDSKVLFPIHPRTKKQLDVFGIDSKEFSNIDFIDPVSYFENIHYLKNAKQVITDSGGLQKEAYILKVPCITIRSETEWTETLEFGWNVLCFKNLDEILSLIDRKQGKYISNLYGDGNAAQEILDVIFNKY